MKRTALWLVAAILLGCSSALASGFGDLESWIGNYPVRDVDGKRRDLLDDTRIKSSLRALLANPDRKKLQTYSQSLPVKAVGNFIVISKCKPHNCPAERAVVVLDRNADRLWVGLLARSKTRVETRWYGNVDDASYLPGEILNGFGDAAAEK